MSSKSQQGICSEGCTQRVAPSLRSAAVCFKFFLLGRTRGKFSKRMTQSQDTPCKEGCAQHALCGRCSRVLGSDEETEETPVRELC